MTEILLSSMLSCSKINKTKFHGSLDIIRVKKRSMKFLELHKKIIFEQL